VVVEGGELLAKRTEGLSLVGVLTAQTATDDHGPRGKMGESDATLRYVLMLSSLTARAKDVHTALIEQLHVGRGNRNPGMGSVFRHQASSTGTSLAV